MMGENLSDAGFVKMVMDDQGVADKFQAQWSGNINSSISLGKVDPLDYAFFRRFLEMRAECEK